MTVAVEPVNYDSHPRFATDNEPWSVESDLINRFTSVYSELLRTGRADEGELLGSIRRIFAALRLQTVNERERHFLEELLTDVEAVLREHIDYYKRSVPLRRDKSTCSDVQLELINKGYYITSISNRTQQRILRRAKSPLESLRNNAANGKKSREDLSINSGPLTRFIVRTLNKEFRKIGVIKALDVLEKRPVRVVGVALELSVPGSTWWKNPVEAKDSPATLYAHVDKSVSAPKSIVYLTDVVRENGPTTCYPGVYENLSINPVQDLVGRCLASVGTSERSPLYTHFQPRDQPLLDESFVKLFMKLPPSLRFNSHFGWDILPGSAIEEFVVSHQMEVVGAAGTSLVFDGARLLHRGGLIESGERVVLQVILGRLTTFERATRAAKYVIKRLQGR